MIAPASEHGLDWSISPCASRSFASSLKGSNHDEQAGQDLLETLRRIKWHLWHGNGYRARDEITGLQFDAEGLETGYPNMRKFLTAIGEFQTYIASNSASLINYGERYRSGERISSAFVEATVNAAISKRFAKKQQMQWSRIGAHLLLQTRTQTLDGSLRSTFRQWYRGMANDNHENGRNGPRRLTAPQILMLPINNHVIRWLGVSHRQLLQTTERRGSAIFHWRIASLSNAVWPRLYRFSTSSSGPCFIQPPSTIENWTIAAVQRQISEILAQHLLHAR